MSHFRSRILTRRRFVGSGALAFGAAGLLAATSSSAANAKMSQDSAAYQTTPKGKARCDACTQWQAPNACKVVTGVISPVGWCSLFAAKT